MEKAIKIRSIEDFERILIERPEWKERIRRLILTEELLNLPTEFKRFVNEDFKPLKSKVDLLSSDVEDLKQDVSVLKQDVSVLKQDVAVLKQDVDMLKREVEVLKKDVEMLKKDVEILKKDVAALKTTVAELKGDVLELKVRDRIGAFLGKLFSKVRLVDFSDFADALYEAKERNLIVEQDIDEVLQIDAVAEGFLRKPEIKKVFLAVEISYVVDKRDVERASKRAEIISRAYEIECIPIALGRKVTKGSKELSREIGVLLI